MGINTGEIGYGARSEGKEVGINYNVFKEIVRMWRSATAEITENEKEWEENGERDHVCEGGAGEKKSGWGVDGLCGETGEGRIGMGW